MRDRCILDFNKFHKPINEDSANEDALFVCGIFLWAFQIGELLDELESTVKFLFQSAEESGHGSNYYVDHGCFEDIDAAMAMHVMNEIPKGTFSIDDGSRMASSDRFVIKIHVKSNSAI